MNIKDAKQQIKNAITSYFTKNEYNEYIIPIDRQRPVFLMGPPGIGKTAIMAQIAQELGIGLVAYSMTHHTRQSAIGLPFITRKTYGGHEYDITEYTMSEIIASVYDMIEDTGKPEGILFLDEINCVSETLSPAMLQFLQFKIFGRHRVPDNWIVVTAGNPPEYNNSVREFDIVTWDRLKRIDIEPDYTVWREYGYNIGVHPSVMTYLELKPTDFYSIETTVDGKQFVTARGWIDLSDMIKLYENHEITVDDKLVSQYLQNPKIAKSFATYYDLFIKYRGNYQVDTILKGNVSESVKVLATEAKFDERLALLGLLLDAVFEDMRKASVSLSASASLLTCVKDIKLAMFAPKADNTEAVSPCDAVQQVIAGHQSKLEAGKKESSLSNEVNRGMHIVTDILQEMLRELTEQKPITLDEAFASVRARLDRFNSDVRNEAAKFGERLANMFAFCEEVFPDGQELLILVSELTENYYSTKFIAKYGCEAYFKYSKDLLFFERQRKLMSELDEIDPGL